MSGMRRALQFPSKTALVSMLFISFSKAFISGASAARNITSSLCVSDSRFLACYRMLAAMYINESNCVALNCQYVGIGPGGTVPMLARASLTDFRGNVIVDFYVAPTAPITNYRTYTTGITAQHLYNDSAMPFERAQRTIGELVRGKIIVGYTLWSCFSILGIRHPAKDTRDVGLYLPFRVVLGQPHSVVRLPALVWHLMRRQIQSRVQDSVENARAALDLYRSNLEEWERIVATGEWPCALPPVSHAQCFS